MSKDKALNGFFFSDSLSAFIALFKYFVNASHVLGAG